MIWSSPYRNGPKSRQHSMMRMPHFFHVWKTQRIAPADPTCGSAASLKQSMTSNRSPLPCFRNSHPLYLSNIWNSIEFTGHSVSRQTDGPPPDIIIKLHFFRTFSAYCSSQQRLPPVPKPCLSAFLRLGTPYNSQALCYEAATPNFDTAPAEIYLVIPLNLAVLIPGATTLLHST